MSSEAKPPELQAMDRFGRVVAEFPKIPSFPVGDPAGGCGK